MKKEDWSNPQHDPNNWSRIKVLYQRINDRREEADVPETQVEAARWLDINECQTRNLNLNQYLQYIKDDNVFEGKYTGPKRRRSA